MSKTPDTISVRIELSLLKILLGYTVENILETYFEDSEKVSTEIKLLAVVPATIISVTLTYMFNRYIAKYFSKKTSKTHNKSETVE